MTERQTMQWCGYHWTNSMEGGRLIDTERPYEWFSPNAVWLGGLGSLSLHIQSEPTIIKHWDGKTYTPVYGVGLVRSVDTFGYGTFSAEIMLPHGRNLWPAFWLCGDGKWPDNGEIDVCEAWSDSKGSYFRWLLPKWNTCSNVHYSKDGGHKEVKAKEISWLQQPKDPSENFVRYEVEWLPDGITFRVNGKVTRRVGRDVSSRMGERMNVILDLRTDTEDFDIETPMIVRNFEYKQ